MKAARECARSGSARALGQIVLIECLPDQRLHNSLAAHIQVLCSPVQVLQHAGSNVYVDPLNRLNHPALALEKMRDVFTLVGQPGNRISRNWSASFTSFLHTAVSPPSLRNIRSLIDPIRSKEQLLRLFETDAAPWIRGDHALDALAPLPRWMNPPIGNVRVDEEQLLRRHREELFGQRASFSELGVLFNLQFHESRFDSTRIGSKLSSGRLALTSPLSAWTHIVEPNQIDIFASTVLHNLEQIDETKGNPTREPTLE
jgi:hypothetical protein